MNTIPIVFAFDNNLAFPAAVCISSLLKYAKEDTFYDIFILHSSKEVISTEYLDRVKSRFQRCRIQYRKVPDTFDGAFEIRGITTPAYYRLLIPEIIPEYDKVIYSDVDVIFRLDMSDLYLNYDMGDNLIAGVNNLAHLDKDLGNYYNGTLGLDERNVICSGFLLMDCKKIKEEGLMTQFISKAKNQYKFQDQDILNITCHGRIGMLSPKYSMLTYIYYAADAKPLELRQVWPESEIDEGLKTGNVHYNGQKPWKAYCLNFDIWWESYRNSPVFDPHYYFDFFYKRLNEYDRLSLIKRVKILARYFVYGRKN